MAKLDAAIAAKDADALGKLAHYSKGAALNLMLTGMLRFEIPTVGSFTEGSYCVVFPCAVLNGLLSILSSSLVCLLTARADLSGSCKQLEAASKAKEPWDQLKQLYASLKKHYNEVEAWLVENKAELAGISINRWSPCPVLPPAVALLLCIVAADLLCRQVCPPSVRFCVICFRFRLLQLCRNSEESHMAYERSRSM